MPFDLFPFLRRRLRARDTVVPAPVNVEPSQNFDGVDGQWSTFVVSIGTPPQNFRVLASTASSETWVISPEGCTKDDPSDCQERRGGEPFNGQASKGLLTNQSSTWKEAGLYTLDLEDSLGLKGAGFYGYDVVGLNGGNKTQNGNGVSVDNSVVAAVATKDYFLGYLGLGARPTSFSSSANNAPSFMHKLRSYNCIPSLSYAFTAGAVYRNKNTFASLVLGGYDSTRFKPTDKHFSFSNNDARPLQVGIQSITATNTLNGTVSMTRDGGHLSLIDSTVSHLWLPEDICNNFAQSLGLTYDNQSGLYILDSTAHQRLVDLNPSFTFKLGDKAFDDGNATNIEVPYSAFDLKIGWPTYSREVNYFPIRRAANNSQYVIGRAFLQEAYLIVDYERKNFTVAKAEFPDASTKAHLIPILPGKPEGSGKLGAGAIAGIVVGAVALIAIIALGFIFMRRRKRGPKEAKMAELDADQSRQNGGGAYGKVAQGPDQYVETGGNEIQELEAQGYLGAGGANAGVWKRPAELASPAPVFEMEGDHDRGGYSNTGTGNYSESNYSTMGTEGISQPSPAGHSWTPQTDTPGGMRPSSLSPRR